MQANIFLLLMTTLSMVSPAVAQTFVKKGKLCLQPNSVVAIQGELLNQGNITNEGLLSVSGDWNNLSSYASLAGTITLAGTDTQTFSHNNQTVYNLTIASSGDVRLTSDVTVKGKLVLHEGIITPDPEVKLMLDEKAVVVGGAPDAYIHGKMYHTGLGSKFYPVGKNGQYAPVTLAQVSGDHPVIGVEFYDNNLPAQGPSDIRLTEDGFFWNFMVASGRFDGSPIALDMPISNPGFLEEDKLVIAGSDNLKEEFKTLDKAKVRVIGGRYVFSSRLPVRSRYITIGTQELLDIEKMVYIPNALSPLAPDPEDRAIKVYSENLVTTDFQWIIWDKWGHQVYATYSYDEAATAGWQGNSRQKGEALPGIYKYLIQGTLEIGQTFIKTVNIILYK